MLPGESSCLLCYRMRSIATDDHATRWDGASVHAFAGTYGDYLLAKVGKVFPELRRGLQLGPAGS